MDTLLMGKVTLEYEDIIKKLHYLGLAQHIAHKNLSYSQNMNTNETLDFILNNLK